MTDREVSFATKCFEKETGKDVLEGIVLWNTNGDADDWEKYAKDYVKEKLRKFMYKV